MNAQRVLAAAGIVSTLLLSVGCSDTRQIVKEDGYCEEHEQTRFLGIPIFQFEDPTDCPEETQK